MYTIYNNQADISTAIRNFFINNTSLTKTKLNFLPDVIFAMIHSESVVKSKIASSLNYLLPFAKPSSIKKRIYRLFTNPTFDGISLFNDVIKFIIDNLKLKHNDKRVHIILDHMYSKDNYTVLCASMRVGKTGIPICFKTFSGSNNSEAFLDSLLISFVKHIDNLFKDKDFELIFLADRWFNSYELLNTIDSLGHNYVIRLKGNINVKIFDSKEGHKIRKQTGNLPSYISRARYYNDVDLYEDKSLTTNIVISKSKGVKEPWILATNGNNKRAIKDYGYRFGGIETIFKNQKSNGFYLEKVCNANPHYFENLYSTMCIALVLLICIGVDYSKNIRCYKHITLDTHSNIHGIKTRMISIFRTGLELFKLAHNAPIYIRLPLTFILYDM